MGSFQCWVREFFEQRNRPLFDDLYARVNREALAPFFRPWLELRGRLLDAGSGSGILAEALGLKDTCLQTHFLDLTWEQIHKLRNKKSAGHFIQADVTRLPFQDNVFDLVLCSNVVHYTGIDGVRELIRVTRRGGRLLLSFLEDSAWTRTWIRLAVLWGWFPPFFCRAPLIDIDQIVSLNVAVEDSGAVIGFPPFFVISRTAPRQGLVALVLKKEEAE